MNEENNEDEIVKQMLEEMMNSLWDDVANESKEVIEAIKSNKSEFGTLTPDRKAQVKSQKALSLIKDRNKNSIYTSLPIELLLLDDDDAIAAAAMAYIDDKLVNQYAFIRACPEVARHGVIESIKVDKETYMDAWRRLAAIMKKEDPNGCMLLQPFIDATSSMVLAPNQYAVVGEGHDGVTASHGRQLYFALKSRDDDAKAADYFESLGQVERDNYELEFVFDRGNKWLTWPEAYMHSSIYLTQVRGSPEHRPLMPPFAYLDVEGNEVLSVINGMIPQGKVEVKQVWVAEGLEEVAWLEENITRELCPEGFVISHPDGSLLSHICAHARGHDIPYIIGSPEIGETWVEGSAGWVANTAIHIIPQPYNPFHESMQEAFLAGTYLSQSRYQRQHGWFSHFFHQWQGMNWNGLNCAVLAGAFAGWVVKAALSVCLGELRHVIIHPSIAKGGYIEVPAVLQLLCSDHFEEFSLKNRKHYFASIENQNPSYSDMKLALEWVSQFFGSDISWSNAYGGKKWQECALKAAEVAGLLDNFMKNMNEENLRAITLKVNEVENWKHNNGSLFDKFLHGTALDYGTGAFPHHERALSSMMRTWELAEKFFTEDNEGLKETSCDWGELFEFLDGKKPAYWRINFMGSSPLVPSKLRDVVPKLSLEHRHIPSKYTDGKSASFIPCGHEECATCKDMDIVIMANAIGGFDYTSMFFAPISPSVFLPLPEGKSSQMTYQVCGLIQNKKYDEVSPEMFVEGWHGLNMNDKMFDVLKEMMKKMLKIEAVKGKDTEWMNEFVELNKDGDE